ncbi:hypothetical protein GL218_07207 [Daldinia childiae]|uniref:uncharacterized protein n=1 Tax=Daldinia childiae TaxID=326645 RepID=UPI0014470A7B|nr:uncharacterized protein GL218_07207 [Daldinia childiae]KAF3055574.1 hypothetical protein GL218_07207 [Daldinia childiae]
MAYLWGPRRALRLAAVLATTASATYIRPNILLERADSTCAADFTKCALSGLPENFCCEPDTTCIALAGNTTVLCCPKGKTCNKINPITCDLALQDPATNPEAEIKTTALDGILETCGTGTCCPFGYHCDGTICVKNTDQSQKPETKPSSISTSVPTSTSSPASASKTTTVAVSEITSATPPPTSPTAPTAPDTEPTDEPTSEPVTEAPAPSTTGTADTVKIVGGVIGGVVGFVFIILAVIFARYKRKKQLQRREQLQRHDSTSSFGNIISAPVPHAKYPNERIDFLAKQPQSSSPRSFTPSSPTAVASPGSHRKPDEGYGGLGFMPPNSPYSPYARRPDSEMSDVPRSYHASAEIGGLRSLTGWNTHQQNGGGNINNYSPVPAPLVTLTPARDGTIKGKGKNKGKGKERARGNEDEDMSINIFADPRTVADGRPDSSVTTWSNIQQRADNNGNATPVRGQTRLGDELPRWR